MIVDKYRYSLRKLDQSIEDVVSIDAAKHNCSIDGDDHDEALGQLIQQAREYCEERTDCSLLTTTWEMTFDRFPCEAHLYLPRWPLQSVDSISYVDGAGATQTIASDQLSVRLDDHGRGRVARVGWLAWPGTKVTPDAVTVTFAAGWTSPELVPAMWSRAMLMLLTWWFEQREAAIIGSIVNEAPIGVKDLLDSVATADDFGEFEL